MPVVRDFQRIWAATVSKLAPLVPSSLISSGPKTEEWSIAEFGRLPLEDLEKYYYSFPLVFQGINLFSNCILGRGFYVESSNPQALSTIKELTDTTAFKQMLLNSARQTLIYGTSYPEIIWNKGNENSSSKKILGFAITDPKSMEPKWDEKGNILEFVQKTKTGATVHFLPEQICMFTFYTIADNLKGIGFIEPLALSKVLETQDEVRKSINEAMKKFSLPPLHVEKKSATDAEILALAKEFEDFDRRKFFGTSERYKIDFLNLYRRFPDLSFLMDYNLNEICAGLRVPKPILLSEAETVNRAVLDALIDFNQYEISFLQEKISQTVEEQIFKRLCEKNSIFDVPKLKWYPLMSEDEKQKAEVKNLEVDSILRAYTGELIDLSIAREKARLIFETK